MLKVQIVHGFTPSVPFLTPHPGASWRDDQENRGRAKKGEGGHLGRKTSKKKQGGAPMHPPSPGSTPPAHRRVLRARGNDVVDEGVPLDVQHVALVTTDLGVVGFNPARLQRREKERERKGN